MADILIVAGHPDDESYGEALVNAYHQGASESAEAAGLSVEVIRVRNLDFDPVLHRGYREDQPLEPDLRRFQDAVRAARHVTWVFPMWWAGLPAKLKGLIDRTFLPGWAFQYRSKGTPEKLLKGRSARVVISMDSPGFWYALYHHRTVLRSFNRGTLGFSGFKPVSNTGIYGVREMSETQRNQKLEELTALGAKDAQRLRS